jgi:hypothetical protein
MEAKPQLLRRFLITSNTNTAAARISDVGTLAQFDVGF